MRIELSQVQVNALLNFMASTKNVLLEVETVDRIQYEHIKSLVDDCEQWRGVLLRALDTPAQRTDEPNRETPQ